MSHEPFKVELSNPGQFLACGGLLTVAHASDLASSGCFSSVTSFQLDTRLNVLELVRKASVIAVGLDRESPAEAQRLEQLQSRKKQRTKSESAEMAMLQDGPLILDFGGSVVRLDWWLSSAMQDAGFKTWSGGQHAYGFVTGMLAHFQQTDTAHLFESRPVKSPKPFYFDSRVSRLTSLDLGFSPDGFTASFSPAVELLAFIGLQWFRPTMIRRRQEYAYATWNQPLPLEAAAAAATGMIPALSDRHYRFPLVRRTGGKYKAFGPAAPATSSTLARGLSHA